MPYSTNAAAPRTTPTTPPTSILPALFVPFEVGLVEGPVLVLEAVEDVAAAVLGATALTSVGMSVPHFLQESEPGLAVRHCWKVASQMKLGMVPW